MNVPSPPGCSRRAWHAAATCLTVLAVCAAGQNLSVRVYPDRLGRLGAVAYGNERAIVYSYDASGNLARRIHVTSENPTADHNGNGMYDLWEALHFGHLDADANADPDGDGLTNSNECRWASHPLNPDTDGDGMPDGWEAGRGLSVTNAADAAGDPDADGACNRDEYEADTDPGDRDSVLSLIGLEMSPEGILLRWRGGREARQWVESRRELTPGGGAWTACFTNAPPTAVSTGFVQSVTNGPVFYRLRASRP